MMHVTHRGVILGVAAGMVLSMPATATAQTPGQRNGGTDCVVQRVNDRGEVNETAAEPDGTVYGQFRCVGGRWEFAWAPYERDDAITASEIQVDPAGAVGVRRFAGHALGDDLTMAEVAAITRATTGSKDAVIGRTIVAVDDGRERTVEEIEALFAGRDTTGVKVLGVTDRPDPAMTVKDLTDGVDTTAPVVVYFSIWGAIKDAFAWVVDRINDAADWISEHCEVGPASGGIGIKITCRF